jgi:hypothetical protein
MKKKLYNNYEIVELKRESTHYINYITISATTITWATHLLLWYIEMKRVVKDVLNKDILS